MKTGKKAKNKKENVSSKIKGHRHSSGCDYGKRLGPSHNEKEPLKLSRIFKSLTKSALSPPTEHLSLCSTMPPKLKVKESKSSLQEREERPTSQAWWPL